MTRPRLLLLATLLLLAGCQPPPPARVRAPVPAPPPPALPVAAKMLVRPTLPPGVTNPPPATNWSLCFTTPGVLTMTNKGYRVALVSNVVLTAPTVNGPWTPAAYFSAVQSNVTWNIPQTTNRTTFFRLGYIYSQTP